MGEKQKQQKPSKPDQVEKLLEDYHDVFADIINVLVYGGEERVKPEDLVDSPTASQIKATTGEYNEKYRDICKREIRENVCYMIHGIENQTDICQTMVIRVMQYDAVAYDAEIKRLKAENEQNGIKVRYPEVLPKGQKLPLVHTIVLYFGAKEWDGPTTLREMLDIPEYLNVNIPDYPIHLVQVAFLEEEAIEMFKSDFRIVAKYFRAKRLGKEEEVMYNERKAWNHVSEMMEFFHTFTKDKRFREFEKFMIEEAKKGEVRMCTLLDAFEKRGAEKGEYRLLERYAKSHNISIEASMEEHGFSEDEKAAYHAWAESRKN